MHPLTSGAAAGAAAALTVMAILAGEDAAIRDVHIAWQLGVSWITLLLAGIPKMPRSARAALATASLIWTSAMMAHQLVSPAWAWAGSIIALALIVLYRDPWPYLGALVAYIVHDFLWGWVLPLEATGESIWPSPYERVVAHMGALAAVFTAHVLLLRTSRRDQIDLLTGLASRRQVAREIERASIAGRDNPVAVCGINGLDLIIESYGHAVADRSLVAYSRRLREHLPKGTVLARAKGDQFIALARSGNPTDLGERMAEQFECPVTVTSTAGPVSLAVTAAAGVTSTAGASSAEEILGRCAKALSKAKRSGEITVVEAPSQATSEQATVPGPMLGDLYRAKLGGELILYYQPVVEVASEEVVSAEALIRWNHPTRGLLLPGEFLPSSECDSRLQARISRMVATEAARQLREWTETLPGALPRGLAINVQPSRLEDPTVVDGVRAIVEATGIDPTRMTLEITESGLMRTRHAARVLRALKSTGVKIALDDFGTGYSSLAHLRDLPIDIVKIDRHFIQHMEESRADREIIAAVTNIARSMGMSVIAEGVETTRQRDIVAELGVRYVQGFLYHQPLPPVALAALIDGRSFGS